MTRVKVIRVCKFLTSAICKRDYWLDLTQSITLYWLSLIGTRVRPVCPSLQLHTSNPKLRYLWSKSCSPSPKTFLTTLYFHNSFCNVTWHETLTPLLSDWNHILFRQSCQHCKQDLYTLPFILHLRLWNKKSSERTCWILFVSLTLCSSLVRRIRKVN